MEESQFLGAQSKAGLTNGNLVQPGDDNQVKAIQDNALVLEGNDNNNTGSVFGEEEMLKHQQNLLLTRRVNFPT